MWNEWVLLVSPLTLPFFPALLLFALVLSLPLPSFSRSAYIVRIKADNRNFSPVSPVEADHISTAPGATGALDQLFHVLADSGDVVLIAAPQ